MGELIVNRDGLWCPPLEQSRRSQGGFVDCRSGVLLLCKGGPKFTHFAPCTLTTSRTGDLKVRIVADAVSVLASPPRRRLLPPHAAAQCPRASAPGNSPPVTRAEGVVGQSQLPHPWGRNSAESCNSLSQNPVRTEPQLLNNTPCIGFLPRLTTAPLAWVSSDHLAE